MSTSDFDPSSILKAFQNYSSTSLNPVEEKELTYEEIRAKSTLETAQPGNSLSVGSLGGPSLTPPDMVLLQLNSTMSGQDITQLKNDHLKQFLDAHPEVQTFLSNTGLDPQDLISKEIPGLNGENSTSLITQNILKNMESLSSLYGDDPAFNQAFNSSQVAMMETNYPTTSFLKDLLINQYISQGASPQEATNLANQQIVNIVNEKMQESGLQPPILNPRPEIGEALINSLTSLSVNSTNNPISQTDLQNFLSQAGFVNAFGTGLEALSTQAKSISPATTPTTTANVDVINKMVQSESEKLQTMLDTVKSFPMPGEMKLAFLQFLKIMAKSLEDLKAFSNQIAVLDAKNAGEKKQSKLEQTSLTLEAQKEKIQEAIDKLKEAEDMKDKLGPLAKVANIMNIIMLVIAAILLVVLTVLLGPVGFLAGLALMSALVTFFAINQTGDMSVMVMGLSELVNQLLESWGVDTTDRPWLGAVVLVAVVGALLVAAILLTIIVVVVAIVIVAALLILTVGVFVVMLIIAALAVVAGIIAIAVAGTAASAATAGVGAVVVLIVAIVAAIATPIIMIVEVIKDFLLGMITVMALTIIFTMITAVLLALITILAQLLLNALISSGLVYRLADALGPALGMNESQTQQLAIGLQAVVCLTAVLFGASVPPEGFEHRYGTSDYELDSGKQVKLEDEQMQILMRLTRIFQFMGKTAGEAYAANIRTDAQNRLDKEDEKYESLQVIFQKLIKLMQKMLEKITASSQGGQGATDMSDIVNEFKTICGQMNNVTGGNIDPSSFDSSQMAAQFQMMAEEAASNISEDDIQSLRDKLATMGLQTPGTNLTTTSIPTDGQTA